MEGKWGEQLKIVQMSSIFDVEGDKDQPQEGATIINEEAPEIVLSYLFLSALVAGGGGLRLAVRPACLPPELPADLHSQQDAEQAGDGGDGEGEDEGGPLVRPATLPNTTLTIITVNQEISPLERGFCAVRHVSEVMGTRSTFYCGGRAAAGAGGDGGQARAGAGARGLQVRQPRWPQPRMCGRPETNFRLFLIFFEIISCSLRTGSVQSEEI